MITESARRMTALEMSEQLERAEAIVHLSGVGHFHAPGRVSVIGNDVWVGELCLQADAEVNVVGDTVRVYFF